MELYIILIIIGILLIYFWKKNESYNNLIPQSRGQGNTQCACRSDRDTCGFCAANIDPQKQNFGLNRLSQFQNLKI